MQPRTLLFLWIMLVLGGVTFYMQLGGSTSLGIQSFNADSRGLMRVGSSSGSKPIATTPVTTDGSLHERLLALEEGQNRVITALEGLARGGNLDQDQDHNQDDVDIRNREHLQEASTTTVGSPSNPKPWLDQSAPCAYCHYCVPSLPSSKPNVYIANIIHSFPLFNTARTPTIGPVGTYLLVGVLASPHPHSRARRDAIRASWSRLQTDPSRRASTVFLLVREINTIAGYEP